MSGVLGSAQRGARSVLSRLDVAFNRLYTWRYNPLYQSGALVVGCFVVLLVTGLYLLLFYRIGAPYESVERITAQAFAGRWIRTLHRYISDLAIVAIAVHALRVFAQDRAWGPRALAWLSGVALTALFFLCGWTGYVMVWDVQGQLIAAEGARLFDFLPIFAEPISRAFVGDRAMPSAFFFMNLFAHIAIPVGIALVLWIHVSRLARTHIMPPRPLFWGVVGLFTLVSVAWPISMAEEADLLRLPTDVPFDVFYVFPLPITRAMPAGAAWLGMVALFGLAIVVPRLTRPERSGGLAPSWVNPRFCTGCEQCYHDCPYEAISMVRRGDGKEGYVGLVDPSKCVSCGICAGSCAPMGVGPPGRTGRDQLGEVEAFIGTRRPSADDVVLVGCRHSAASGRAEVEGAPVFLVPCVGAMHTSVVEYLVRAGAAGVLVVGCPPRDCWNREGVTWLVERAYHGREAELQARVDRRRVGVVHAAELESGTLETELARFRELATRLEGADAERRIEIDSVCQPPAVSVAEGADS
ncbi:MAG TPA: cytochrome b N-terminal domain-containing protein [Longimicrobiales bacterium]|nr:cytochrome b N-terminal domain-containing protein [Longimicrobiales bacterium]